MVGFGKKKNPDSPDREVFLFTTEVLPEKYVIKEMFQMIEVHDSTIISKQSLLDRVFSGKKNRVHELLKTFASAAPKEANAILGVKTSTTAASFSNESYLMVTHTGTPAIIEYVGAAE